ncbi:hypothetical protein BC835DRAFT_271177 [Cytidiella melzeri]|nr:hypothetical protein BC835DRAFT_271177 [Cytidiella melzeri]
MIHEQWQLTTHSDVSLMEPISPRPSTSPRPKKKFSLRNIRARFTSTGNVDLDEDLNAAVEWSKLQPQSAEPKLFETVHPYPYSPSGFSSGTSSPTTSSQNSARERVNSQPLVPLTPNRFNGTVATSPKRKTIDRVNPVNSKTGIDGVQGSKADPTNNSSDLPWHSQVRSPGYVSLADGHTRRDHHASNASGVLNSVADEDTDVINRSVSVSGEAHVVAAQTMVAFAPTADPGTTLQKMKSSMNDLPVEIPGLLNALDEIAKIHVSISIVVLAFKAAYNMERTRRENDKRILLLYVAMKDMLTALLQLRDVRDPLQVGPDGHPIRSRLESVSKMAAQDIKECANTCDTYLKKTLVVKVLRSQSWEARLASFLRVFAQRRQDFEFALMIHTANTVDSINATVKDMNQKIAELTSMVLDVYRREWTPPGEVQLARKVKEKGGVKYVENSDAVLSELAGLENPGAADKIQTTGGHVVKLQDRSAKESTFTLQDLKDELHEGWQAAVQKNMETFEGKFALYQRQLQEELARVIREDNNRIIDELNRGPHDKIKDEELRAVWKEMDWKLNVKARLFVMTLRDHYRDKADNAALSSFNPGAASDDWAFEFINAKYLQPIMEAFDDDGSGYVTYQEVNEFVDSRPVELNWSLPHWVAYWAIGWQATSAKYGEYILELFNHLFSMRSSLLPENRYWADYYLKTVWPVAFELIKSFRPANVPEHIEAKFKAYTEHEESRMRKNLEDIRFDIDALDTVYVVAGPGRIEKYLFTLVYLLLKRDVEVFHIAKQKVLHKEELLDSADSLLWVFRAVNYRYLDLAALFKQNHLNVDSQMKVIACGLFDYLHNSSSLWTWRNMQLAASEPESSCDKDFSKFDQPFLNVLNYPLKDDHRFKCELYEANVGSSKAVWEADARAGLPVRALLGEWNGYVYTEDQYPSQLMVSFRIHAVPSNPEYFTASGMHDGVTFQVSGRCTLVDEREVQVRFSIRYSKEYSTQYFSGYLDASGTIAGTEGWEEDEQSHDHRFFLKRQLAKRFLRYRPLPSELQEHKARALWKFAINAAIHHIRRQNWTWEYILERRETRMRYIELSIRYTAYGHRPNETELAEWTNLLRNVAPIDASFFRILREHQLKTIPNHDCYCRGCGGKIGGARVVCLDCLSSESEAKTVDFCDNPACPQTTFVVDIRDPEKRHLPTHDVFKVRSVLHLRDVPAVSERVGNALSVAREYFQTSIGEIEDTPMSARINGGFYMDDNTLDAYFDDKSEHMVQLNGHSNVSCGICQKSLEQPCWYCADCFALEKQLYICEDCEPKMLLRCAECDRPYKQPTWYYGAYAIDNFLCSTCTARRVEATSSFDRSKQHSYLHTLVRCARKPPSDAKAAERSAEERMAALEQTVWALTGNVGRVEETLSRIERLLLSTLAGKQSSNGTSCPHCHPS